MLFLGKDAYIFSVRLRVGYEGAGQYLEGEGDNDEEYRNCGKYG